MAGVVLVIEDDEWVSRLLAVAIREAMFDAEICGTAQSGLDTAIELEPDCIVCDVDLPDHDGYWVAQNVRTQPSRVSVTPFLFLSSLDDQESRLQGFHVGADVYMTKPFRVDEVVAQVTALVQMAERLRQRRDTFLSMPPEEASAIEGDLSQMSIATVLTVLEMERRTGTFEVVSKKRRASLDIASGCIEGGTIGGTGVDALSALRTMVGWNVGRFSFTPEPSRTPPSGLKSIGAILIEAVRLDDESKADRKSSKLAAPTLGGPQSDPSDMSPPPSTRSKPAAPGKPSPPVPITEVDDDDWDTPHVASSIAAQPLSDDSVESERGRAQPPPPKAVPPVPRPDAKKK
jgi:two-component system, OmpR family, response regulator